MSIDGGSNGSRWPWWEAVEAKLVALDAVELPDPWAGHEVDQPVLTDAQLAFLVRLDDQPEVPRLAGIRLVDGPRSAAPAGD